LVLHETSAILEYEEHGWMQDRADPHARERALTLAHEDPPAGVSPDQAVAEIRDVNDSIGDTCPECPPEDWKDRRRISAPARYGITAEALNAVARIKTLANRRRDPDHID
jgi:hypothetical protein